MRIESGSSLFALVLSVLLVGTSTTAAQAYLDAGTGSMILQLLLGGIAGLMVVGKLYWHKLLVALRIRSDADPRDDARQPVASGLERGNDR